MLSRIPVAILGATGAVGQRFVQLLARHPWFEVAELVASERSAGRPYAEACAWRLPGDAGVAGALPVLALGTRLRSRLLFSGLDPAVAGEAEADYAARGCAVLSNARHHRMAADVPLLIPEVNAAHLAALPSQRARTGGGYIVTNPNCSVVGLALPLGALHAAFGVLEATVVTLQALSGAGYPGVTALDIADNVIPFIGGGEEEKLETEPQKILGSWDGRAFQPASFGVSASVHRVGVVDGHTLAAFVKLARPATVAAAREALASFRGAPQALGLPSAPQRPIHVLTADDRPQPRLDRDREQGMAVSVGRVRADARYDLRFEALVHNTIRGAAGAAILNAELLKAEGLLPEAEP